MSVTIKEMAFQRCMEVIAERIAQLEEAMTQARNAALDDTKSSAGDKYETTREMMQQEINRNAVLLYEAVQQKNILKQLVGVSPSDQVKNGNLVYTSQGNFYLAIGIGELIMNQETIMAISQASPVGKMLMNKKIRDTFLFLGKTYQITAIL